MGRNSNIKLRYIGELGKDELVKVKAYDGVKQVGSVEISYYDDETEIEIRYMEVKEEYRDKGIGKEMVRLMQEQTGLSLVGTITEEGEGAGVGLFWERCGAEFVNAYDFRINGGN